MKETSWTVVPTHRHIVPMTTMFMKSVLMVLETYKVATITTTRTSISKITIPNKISISLTACSSTIRSKMRIVTAMWFGIVDTTVLLSILITPPTRTARSS